MEKTKGLPVDFTERPPETTIDQMAEEITAGILEDEKINSHEELMDNESDIFMESAPIQDLIDKVYIKLSENNFPIEKHQPQFEKRSPK